VAAVLAGRWALAMLRREPNVALGVGGSLKSSTEGASRCCCAAIKVVGRPLGCLYAEAYARLSGHGTSRMLADAGERAVLQLR